MCHRNGVSCISDGSQSGDRRPSGPAQPCQATGQFCSAGRKLAAAQYFTGAMAYNRTMKQLTLVLPFALPPPELAPDLLRAMQTPALSMLLARSSRHQVSAFDNSCRILPHEAWLAHALGLSAAPDGPDAGAAFAVAAMRGFGLTPDLTPDLTPGLTADAGTWFLVHPVHVQIARKHLLMGDPRQLTLDEADARALFEAAKPYFEELGKPLLYGDAHTWFVRADDWAGLRTASPDAATGQNLNAWMPEGAAALATRKLQNEVQMLWYQHPVNAAREQRGLAPINSFWLWGGASAAPAPPPVFCHACPPWLTALAAPKQPALSAEHILSHPDALLVLGTLSGAGLAADWSGWLTHMEQLEQDWFAPLLAAVRQGRLDQLTLVFSHRDAYAVSSTTKNAQRTFWRKPSLKKLLP